MVLVLRVEMVQTAQITRLSRAASGKVVIIHNSVFAARLKSRWCAGASLKTMYYNFAARQKKRLPFAVAAYVRLGFWESLLSDQTGCGFCRI